MDIINPPGWKRPKGYSNGIVTSGRQVYVAGQVGWNTNEEFEAHDFAGQAAQALRNIADILAAAGAKPEHVVRMTWFITDKDAYFAAAQQTGIAYREIFGRHYPVMSVIVIKELIETGAMLEIEATAVIPA